MPHGWVTGSELGFAIETTHPDGERRFSGTVSLRDEGAGRAELAFGAHPAIRGRGVMTTAVTLLLDWAFATRDLQTVIWWANRGNVGSRRVAWKAGFTFGGTVRRWLDHRGEYPDAWVATLHRDDSREPKTRWLEMPVISGADVTLRPLADRDAERVVEGCSDARTRQFLTFLPHPYLRSDALDYLIAQHRAGVDRNRCLLGRCRLGDRHAAGHRWAAADGSARHRDRLLGAPRCP